MANTLLIEKETGGYYGFTLTIDGVVQDKIRNMFNDAFGKNNLVTINNSTGANLVKKQNISVFDITLIASGTFTFTDIDDFLVKLIDIGFFDWRLGTGGGSGATRFDDLLDTFQYFGQDGKGVRVNESEQKLETYDIYNYRNITDLEDTYDVGIPNKMLVTDNDGNVVLEDKITIPQPFLNSIGSFLYADLATQTTPLNGIANVEKNLTNDIDGVETDLSNSPYGVSTTWNSATNRLDFSQLSIGDVVDLRVFLSVTTTVANQNIQVYARVGLGTTSEKDFLIGSALRTTAGIFIFEEELKLVISKEDYITAIGEIYLFSESNSTIKVNEFEFVVTRKNVNITVTTVDEAPIDGLIYGRKNAIWEEITGVSGSAKIVTKTRAEIDTLISGNDLVPLTVYEITGVDATLYGGSTIYLQAITDNTLAVDGIGKFYNPKYNQAVSGFDVWASTGTYSIADKVHWGGKTWENVAGNVGASTDLFTLDSEWTLIAFNHTDYNIAYDAIKYDYANDVIVYRNEQNSNIVSTSFINIQQWDYSPIKVFMWGNYLDNILFVGIGNQQIIGSYNENINFKGAYQNIFTFTNGSYQKNVTFSNGSFQEWISFDNSYQDNLNFDDSSQTNLNFEVSAQINLTFSNGSSQQRISLINSNQQILDFENSTQLNLNLNNSIQSNLIFSNDSAQINFIFENSNQNILNFENFYQSGLYFTNSYQLTLTGIAGKFQQNITILNYSYDRVTNPFTDNEIALMFQGDLPISTTATKMIVKEDNQLKEMDIPSVGKAGSFTATGTATTTFTVTIGTTQANNTYKVVASPSNALSAVMFYINNKTTTTFDVVFVTGLTGAVAFDWILKP